MLVNATGLTPPGEFQEITLRDISGNSIKVIFTCNSIFKQFQFRTYLYKKIYPTDKRLGFYDKRYGLGSIVLSNNDMFLVITSEIVVIIISWVISMALT